MNNENIFRLVGYNYTANFLNLYSVFQKVTEIEDNKENNIKKQIKINNKIVKEKKINREKDNKKNNNNKENNRAENSREEKPIKIK